MTSVTINGHTYSDDGTSARDMLNGGHNAWLIPMVSDVVVGVSGTAADAAAASASATLANTYAQALRATSSTSLSVGTGAKVFTIAAGKQFQANDFVMVTRSGGAQWMYALVTSYASTTLTLSVQQVSGSGTYTDWIIGPCGVPGATGAVYSMTAISLSTTYAVVAGDKGKVIVGTGTVTLAAYATLATGFHLIFKAEGGDITIDPSGVETINGASTYVIKSGSTAILQGNGTTGSIITDSPSKLQKLPIFSASSASMNPSSSGELLVSKYAPDGLGSAAKWSMVTDGTTAVTSSLSSSLSVASTTDGLTYTLRTMPSSQVWALNKNTVGWIAVATGGTATANSTNGTTWSSATARAASCYGAPVSVAGRVAVLRESTTSCDYSDDNGATWTNGTLPAASRVTQGLMVSGGLFLYFSTLSSTYYTSATAATSSWTSRTCPINPTVLYSGVGGEVFAAIASGSSTSNFYYTVDGINWVDTGIYAGAGPSISAVPVGFVNTVMFWAGSGFIATIHNGKYVSRTMPLYSNSPGTAGRSCGVVFGNNLLVPVIATSADSTIAKIAIDTATGYFTS